MSGQNPLISICIPSYKRYEHLIRLLNSITIQSFKNYEIIISDDSPGDEVFKIFQQYQHQLPIAYFHNNPALGTPANWNSAIRHAKGSWIKLMHDDDCFVESSALQKFAKAIDENPDADFIFSAYRNRHEHSTEDMPFVSRIRWKALNNSSASLLSKNIIGPPSTTLIKKSIHTTYDERLQWLVDIDFYIRVLTASKFCYIRERLIDIGINEEQVTNKSSRNPAIEIPEFFMVYEKLSLQQQQNIFVYDAAWRLLRNFRITHPNQIFELGYRSKPPEHILKMIQWQRKFPAAVLRFGPASKSLMFLHALLNR